MRDLWNDLARRVREADRVEQPEIPFGFADAVLRKLQNARREVPNLLDDWIAVLRPALGLAFGTALVCILLQYRVQSDTTNVATTATATDAVTQTEQLLQLALAND